MDVNPYTFENEGGMYTSKRGKWVKYTDAIAEIDELIGLVKSTEEELELEKRTMGMFMEGQELSAVFFQGDAHHRAGVTCTSISVSMENGQHSGVPWIHVVDNDDIVTMWNAELIEGVEFMPEDYD
ncbi:MAG: hypothetical protein GY820_38310 [Gammaproteobacteria bacterium]|nr:hypothetical protein [Gammaproteobacteria bacterium]